jgi:hypothetical protein
MEHTFTLNDEQMATLTIAMQIAVEEVDNDDDAEAIAELADHMKVKVVREE